jgi:dCMP deaminase
MDRELLKLERYRRFHMDVARRAADLSFATRRKVGSVAVNGNNILAYGFNGTPAGHDNWCEDENGETLPTVLHAEENMIAKLRATNMDVLVHDVYVTKEPCVNCATLMTDYLDCLQTVFYEDVSATQHGVGLTILKMKGVRVIRMS